MEDEFVKWDDLDLDTILGEWTDDDEEIAEIVGPESEWDDSTSDEPGEPVEVTHSSPKKRTKETDKQEKGTIKKHFCCPLCPKEYTSTSGFRGHVIKKHNRPDLKAHLHQRLDSATDKIELRRRPIPLTSAEDIRRELPTLTEKALKGIRDDAVHAIPSSFNGPHMIRISTCLLLINLAAIHTLLLTHLVATFVISGGSDDLDISKLLNNISRLRVNNLFLNEFCKTIASVLPPNTMTMSNFHRKFAQRFITEFAAVFFARQNALLEKSQKLNEQATTDNDKQVLHYICGFLIHSLRQKYMRLKSIKSKQLLNAIGNLCATENHGNMPSSWTETMDRGGLKSPCPKFYSMIVQVEKWVREVVVAKNLHSNSLVNLKATILEYNMLKISWDKLITDSSCKWILLEHIISLFLKVRGFAVTKLYKKTLQKNRKKSSRKAGNSRKALRKDLKNLNDLNFL